MIPARLLVLLTSVVASVSYIGAVTQPALLSMVLPSVLAVGLVASCIRGRALTGAVWVVLSAGVVGELVNVASGDYQGSVARSTGVAALCTGLAVVLTRTRRPSLFLLPVVGIVAWALALGAGGRVQLVAIATAVCAAGAFAAVERDERRFEHAPRRSAGSAAVALAFLLVVVGAGVGVSRFQLHHDGRTAASPFRGSLETTIQPPAFLSLTKHPPPSATLDTSPTSPAPESRVPRSSRARQLLSNLTWVFLVLAALVLTVLVGRLLWVLVAWRMLRRRLVLQAEPREAGAWTWARAGLARLNTPLPVNVSPDVALTGGTPVSEELRILAQAIVPVLFGPSQPEHLAVDAWPRADALLDSAWESAGIVLRTRARLVTPAGILSAR